MTTQLAALQNSIKGYQRHRPVIDNLLMAGFLALWVYRVWTASGLFGMEWALVVGLAVLALGAQNRAWGYYAGVAALLLPLWNLSPYLMTLFLAAALVPRLWLIEHLPGVLMVISAPLLAEWHVLGLAPLLAGLAGGPAAGFGVGIASALWIKIMAGLAQLPAELGALHGVGIPWNAIAAHAQPASSLEIVRLLAAPFIAGSSVFLLHSLQCVGWGIGGWLVGRVRRYQWVKGTPRFVTVPTLASGALMLWATLFMLPAWLSDSSPLAVF